MLKLRELRIEKNVTQQEIAGKIGVSRQVYANWENGINQPDLRMLIILADLFSVSTDYLLGRTDDFGNTVSPTSPLSDEETELLNMYRTMNQAQKVRLLGYGEGLSGINITKSKA